MRSPAEFPAARLCAAGWTAAGVAAFSGPSARAIVLDLFGLPTTTFEDNLREPAAGLLELFSPLLPLEAMLLLALANGLSISAEDRSRIGGALSLTSAGVAACFGSALASGMPVTNVGAVVALLALATATGTLGYTAACSIDNPVELYKADALELVSIQSPLDLFDANDVSTFYRSSTLTGLLVGSAFLFSPVSPIAVFDEELPVTHMMRQDLGLYIIALLCPIQAALCRAACQGSLGSGATRVLNAATGIAIALLVLDGKVQVDLGTNLYAQLPPDSPLIALVQGGDASRPEANTTAAFSVGLIVACVYLFQAAFNRNRAEPAALRRRK